MRELDLKVLLRLKLFFYQSFHGRHKRTAQLIFVELVLARNQKSESGLIIFFMKTAKILHDHNSLTTS